MVEFHDKYGTATANDAFGVSKPTMYRWRRKYLKSKKDATALIPLSTRPKNIRMKQSNPFIVDFIKELRMEHRRIGKEKIKPLLDAYCQEKGIYLRTNHRKNHTKTSSLLSEEGTDLT